MHFDGVSDFSKKWEKLVRIEWAGPSYRLVMRLFTDLLGPDVVETWDDTEVARRRWLMLCPKRKDALGQAK